MDEPSTSRFLLRSLNVDEFVETRLAEVSRLLHMTDNHKLVSGEVTRGPRTVMQRLARLRRRRAMSHHLRRLPKRMHAFATPYITPPTKRPSRFARRRPRNLMLSYIARQSRPNGVRWLETHIWHARRFHMTRRWGWAIPIRPTQRSNRAAARDSRRSAVLADVSYLACFQVVFNDRRVLVEKMDHVLDLGTSSADVDLEHVTIAMDPDKNRVLGPVRFHWTREPDSLILWTHPACADALLRVLVERLAVEKVHDNSETPISDVPTSLEAWRQERLRVRTDHYRNHAFTVFDLRGHVVRLRLVGPRSIGMALSLKNGRRPPRTWPDSPKDGLRLGLTVPDPRSYLGLKMPVQNSGQDDWMAETTSPPSGSFWSLENRLKMLTEKLPKARIDQMRAEQTTGYLPVDTKIDLEVVMTTRRQFGGRSGAGPPLGCDVLAPAGWGLDIWMALVRAGARPVGSQQLRRLNLEGAFLGFPFDWTDIETDNTTVTKKRFRGDATEIDLNLAVDESKTKSIIRDRRRLALIDLAIRRRRPIDENLTQPNELVAVRLASRKGRAPMRGGSVYLPKETDRARMFPTPMDSSSTLAPAPKPNDSMEVEAVAEKKVDFSGVVPLSHDTSAGTVVSLRALFPDRKKEIAEQRARKKTDKKRERRRKKNDDKMDTTEPSKSKDDVHSPRIGFIVHGDRSDSAGCPVSLALIDATKLVEISKRSRGRFLLWRNPTSPLLNAASFRVLTVHTQL